MFNRTWKIGLTLAVLSLSGAGLTYAYQATPPPKTPAGQPSKTKTPPPQQKPSPAGNPQGSSAPSKNTSPAPMSIEPPLIVKASADKYFETGSHEIHKQMDHGMLWFEATGAKDGTPSSIRMTEAGDIVETQKMMGLETLPSAIRSSIIKAHPSAKLEKVQSVEMSFYLVSYMADGRQHDLRVYANGQVVPDPESTQDSQQAHGAER